MDEIVTAPGTLRPGPIGPGPQDIDANGLEVRTRYLVALNVILEDGSRTLLALTSYLPTVGEAQRHCDDLKLAFPRCGVVWATALFDTADERDRRELEELDAAIAAQRQTEGYQ